MSMQQVKVIFIGSNPSCTSPVNDPFSHCKSANKMLNEWIPALGLTRDQVEFMNVANYKTPGNKPLKVSQIRAELPRLAVRLSDRIVVTLGETAWRAIKMLEEHQESEAIPLRPLIVLKMPHPSGLNRQLNDKQYVADLLTRRRDEIQAALAAVSE